MKTIFYNGSVITPETVFHGGVEVEGSKIIRVFKGDDFEKTGTLVDCKGNFISPGFVDLHVHGAYEAPFFSGNLEDLHRGTKFHAMHGTTSILPTTASASHDEVLAALKCIKEAMGMPNEGARILGAHIEGNYMNPVCAGAQNPEYLYKADPSEYMELIDTGIVRRVSASPEVEGVLDMARRLAPQGILMSIAHSNGDYSMFMRAIEAGFTHITHIYNAQSMLSNCYFYPQIGVCEAALLHDEITVEAICDGRHVPAELLRLIHKVKGPDRMHATTDAILSGAPDGSFRCFDMDLLVEDEVCMLASRVAFAGSVATTDRLVRTLYKDAHIPIVDAVKMITLTPARMINEQNHIGRLAEGYDADINVFDDNINILATMILGKMFFNKLS
ncbi:MAG TPA: N-acetylglucosamine-6-phosphate deacetylase [Clostridiaceae bacterium]|nr:N-acetylglucosamine-6-phosphate deacetylase [Clostridiaceae bacterium]